VPWFGILGVFVAELFMPDTTGLDLREQERCWTFVREGRAADTTASPSTRDTKPV
jgi:hypothetical protein